MAVLDNARHELFAQAVAKGSSATEAYEKAGYAPNQPNASRLISNDMVQARITEIQTRAANRAEVTIASLTEELEEARCLALKEAQASAAVTATMGKAKLHGLGPERHELTGKNGAPIETKEISDTEYARRIAFILAKGAA